MPQFDEKHVKLCGGIIVWDGVTRPEVMAQGVNAGKPKWSLKIVFEPNNPDVALFAALSTSTLQQSQFRGVLPAGGYMPVGVCGPTEFNGLYNGWSVVSFKTTLRVPDVYDEAGAPLDAMQYAPMMYSGQRVDVLAHCYEYNQKAKGIAAGLDAFAIIASANAPRQDFGGTRVDSAEAFGGGAGPQSAAFDPVTGQPIAAGPQPAAFDPVTGQPIAAGPQPAAFDPVTGQPIQHASTQAKDFMPSAQPAAPIGYNPQTGQPIYA